MEPKLGLYICKGCEIGDSLDVEALIKENIKLSRRDNLQSELAAFIEAVEKKRSPEVNGEDGLQALKTARQIEQLCLEYQNRL